MKTINVLKSCYIFNKFANSALKQDYTKPTKHLDPNINKKLLFTLKNYKIYLVDAEEIRDQIDIDFTQGGNPSRYTYVPNDEIWIEETLSAHDIAATILHEIIECFLMKKDKLSYDNAHDKAAKIEREFRQNPNQQKTLFDIKRSIDEFINNT